MAIFGFAVYAAEKLGWDGGEGERVKERLVLGARGPKALPK